jgi:alkylhydroperoxidase family enzyme
MSTLTIEKLGETVGALGPTRMDYRQAQPPGAESVSERREPGIPASSERGPSAPAAQPPRAESMSDTPRIEPLPPDQWSDDVRAGIAALRPPDARHEVRRRKGGLNVLGTLARHPSLMRAYHTFNGHILFTSTLTPRQRELLVLRVAKLRDAEYEWEQHVIVGRDAGLDDDDIARIGEGPDAPGWSPLDAAMLRAVDELVADAMITDATWAALAAVFDEQQLMDLVFTVGAYEVLAMAFRSFRVQLDEDLARERRA